MVLAVVAAVVAALRPTPHFDKSTPEGTAQLFVSAVVNDDDQGAVELLDPTLGCGTPLRDVYRPTSVSMSVVDVTRDGDTARVVLYVTEQGSGGLLDSFSHNETYDLKADNGGWLITGLPWPVFSCK